MIVTGVDSRLRVESRQGFAFGLGHAQMYMLKRIFSDPCVYLFQQMVESNPFCRRHVDHATSIDQALTLGLWKQVDLIHHVEPGLVLRFKLA